MPRLPGVIQIAVLLLAAASSRSPDAAAAVAALPPPAKASQAIAPASPAPATAPAPAPETHLLGEPAAAAAPAMDPILPQAAAGAPTAGSILVPGRQRKPLVRSASASEGPGISPFGSEIPDGPVAAADAPSEACAEPRPSACNLDYKPVCATAATSVMCVRAPCPQAHERKTYSSICNACRDPKVSAYVSGTCPKQ